MSWQTTSGDRIETARSAVPAGARREPAARLPGAARRADPVRRGRDRPVRRPRRSRGAPGEGAGPGPGPDAGRFVGLPPAGDFTLAAQVSVEFASMYDAGVLLLHAAERQWAKLCFEYSPQLRPTAVTVVTRGTSDDCNSFEVEGSTLWLRITRSGSAWAFHASTDGSWWRLLRYFALDAAVVRAGLPGPVAHRRGLRRDLRPHLLSAWRPEEPPRRQLRGGGGVPCTVKPGIHLARGGGSPVSLRCPGPLGPAVEEALAAVRAAWPRCSPRRSRPGSRSRPRSRCPSWPRCLWASAWTGR